MRKFPWDVNPIVFLQLYHVVQDTSSENVSSMCLCGQLELNSHDKHIDPTVTQKYRYMIPPIEDKDKVNDSFFSQPTCEYFHVTPNVHKNKTLLRRCFLTIIAMRHSDQNLEIKSSLNSPLALSAISTQNGLPASESDDLDQHDFSVLSDIWSKHRSKRLDGSEPEGPQTP